VDTLKWARPGLRRAEGTALPSDRHVRFPPVLSVGTCKC
jgi:hypothetical protein